MGPGWPNSPVSAAARAIGCVLLLTFSSVGTVRAQHASDDPVASASDAFGLTLGLESIGLYGPGFVRGFNPQTAGNVRIDGLYFDQQGALSNRVVEGSTIRIGISEVGYAFPAPTGIVDYDLRHTGNGTPSCNGGRQCRPLRGPRPQRRWQPARDLRSPAIASRRELSDQHANVQWCESRLHVNDRELRRDARVDAERSVDLPWNLRLDADHQRQDLAHHPHGRRLPTPANPARVLRAELGRGKESCGKLRRHRHCPADPGLVARGRHLSLRRGQSAQLHRPVPQHAAGRLRRAIHGRQPGPDDLIDLRRSPSHRTLRHRCVAPGRHLSGPRPGHARALRRVRRR